VDVSVQYSQGYSEILVSGIASRTKHWDRLHAGYSHGEVPVGRRGKTWFVADDELCGQWGASRGSSANLD
jgi:hypothetical protein